MKRALNYSSDAATELTAAKSVDLFDQTSAGLYAVPGTDIISSILVTNIGNCAADADSIVIIDSVPSDMTFYNGDMDDGVGQSRPDLHGAVPSVDYKSPYCAKGEP